MRREGAHMNTQSDPSAIKQLSGGEVFRLCLIAAAVSGIVGFMAFPTIESLWGVAPVTHDEAPVSKPEIREEQHTRNSY